MEASLLGRVSHVIDALSKPESVMGAFSTVLTFMKSESSCDVALVGLVNEDGHVMRLVAAAGLDDEVIRQTEIPLGEGLLGACEGQVSLRHVAPDADLGPLSDHERAILKPGGLVASVWNDGQEVGVVALIGGGAAANEARARDAAELGARLCGWALRHVNLFQDLQKRISELTAVVEIGKEIVSTLNTDSVLNLALQQATHLLGCETCSLMLLDDERRVLTIHKAIGLPEGVAETVRIPLGTGIAGRVAASGKAVLIRDLDKELSDAPRNRGHYRTRSLLSVPLVYRCQTIGVLNVNNKKGDDIFSAGDLNLLTLLANQVAIAIQNARLHTRVQELAITDGLTGLYNRVFFLNELQTEYRRARLNEVSLSVVLADIDHFKNVNDTYGHATGDDVLATVAKVLRQGVRDRDVVARYGGEEFIVLLRGAPLHVAEIVAERLRASVENATFRQPGLHVTASFGIAAIADRYADIDELVSAADQEMYRAKQTGRNRICCVGG
jgi:diguanylate cyclase (GGDEF)-like protein